MESVYSIRTALKACLNKTDELADISVYSLYIAVKACCNKTYKLTGRTCIFSSNSTEGLLKKTCELNLTMEHKE